MHQARFSAAVAHAMSNGQHMQGSQTQVYKQPEDQVKCCEDKINYNGLRKLWALKVVALNWGTKCSAVV